MVPIITLFFGFTFIESQTQELEGCFKIQPSIYPTNKYSALSARQALIWAMELQREHDIQTLCLDLVVLSLVSRH